MHRNNNYSSRRRTSPYNNETTTEAIKFGIPSVRYALATPMNALRALHEAFEDFVQQLTECPLFDTLEKRSVFFILLDQLIKSDPFRRMTTWRRRDLSFEDSCRSEAARIPPGTHFFVFSFLLLIIRLRHTKQPFSVQLIIASALCALCFLNIAFSQMQLMF